MFGGFEKDLVLSPVDILQSKGTQLAASHAIGVKQLHDGVVPPTCMAVTVDAAQDLLRFGIAQPAWDRGQFVSAQGGNSEIQRPLDIALVQTEPQEASQSRLHGVPCGAPHVLSISQKEFFDSLCREPYQAFWHGFWAQPLKELGDQIPTE